MVWALGAGTWQREHDLGAAGTAASEMYQVCSEQYKNANGPKADCTNEFERTWAAWLQGSWGNVAALAFVPIPLAWAAAYGLVGITRWVRRGFKPSP